MFSYKDCTIHSAVSLPQIKLYLSELGAEQISPLKYRLGGLEVEIAPSINPVLNNLNIPRHTIEARGERAAAEDFLTGFRMRFLSAGG